MASHNNVPKEILESIRECLQDRRVKLSIKRLVNYETRKDKIENRVLAFSTYRLFIFTAKTPKDTKLENHMHYLDIKSIESKRPNHLVLTTSTRSYTFTTLEPDTDEVNHMITHIGTSLKTVFQAFPIERLIMTIEVQPPDRLNVMYDIMRSIEQKEVGPCGGYTLMYACMCDFHGLTFRDEVAWDVDTIYLSQDSRELRLRDFDHLRERDLVPIVSALCHNTWFTSFNANNVRLSADVCTEVLRVMKKNSVIEALLLSNTGISTDFIKKLSTISMTGTQLHKLDLSGNMIDDIGAEHIFGSLSSRGRPFTWLDVSRTKITSKGLNKMAECMNRSPHVFSSLQTLRVNGLSSGNKIEDLQSLYTYLASPNMISYLDLSGTDVELDKLMTPLQRGCSQNIVTLKLSKTAFSNKKTREVVVQSSFKQFFATVFALKHLDLSNCKIPPEAIMELLIGISSNRNLKDVHLDISGVDLTSQGAAYLQKCLTQNITSLNISNIAFSEQDMIAVLNSIGQTKAVKNLYIGRVFQYMKPKNLRSVMEELVQVLQDDESVIESLSLADSRLKDSMNLIINALGSNTSLTEIDISGNLMGDLGARMLSKALQINNKLKTIFWDKNSTTCQGFEDVAEALEQNYVVKKMPVPVYDASSALQKQPERTEQALQTIERLLQRNHSPQKYSSDQAYRLQQGFLISSTQQMVDRLVVQSQDTINALTAMHAVDEYSNDVEEAKAVIEDADNSKTLLPMLHDIAIQSQNNSSPVSQKLKDIAKELSTVLENQMKKTVQDMLDTTTAQFKAVMKDKGFMTDLEGGCKEKSALPKDFTTNVLGGVDTDIFNTLSELNLAVAAHVSDRVIDEVINRLSNSHKTLTNHLNECKKGAGRRSQVTKSTKLDETDSNIQNNDSDSAQLRVKDSPALRESPKMKDKRKSIHARKIRPQSVIDELDSSPDQETKRDRTPEPEIEIDEVPDLPTQNLTHITKGRARRAKNVRPTTRQSALPSKGGSETEQNEEDVEQFFFSQKSSTTVNAGEKKNETSNKSSSTKSTPESKKKLGSLFNFGHKDKDSKGKESKTLGGFLSKLSNKPSSPSPKKGARISDVQEESDDVSSTDGSLTRSVTENSSLRGSTGRQSGKSVDSSPSLPRSSTDNSLLGDIKERTEFDRQSSGRKSTDSVDKSPVRKSTESLDKKSVDGDKDADSNGADDDVKDDTDVKQEVKKPLKPPASKSSLSKADKSADLKSETDVDKEDKDDSKEESEEKNEENDSKPKEIAKDDADDNEDKEPSKPPVSVAKRPGGPGGIGFGVNLLAEMKSKQEKRKSQLPAKPAVDKSDKPAVEKEDNDKKFPFGTRGLKPLNKVAAKGTEPDTKNDAVPVKPADNKTSDKPSTGISGLDKKGEPVSGDKSLPSVTGEKSASGLKKTSSNKSETSEKPAFVPRPSGINKPPPPTKPRPPPPGSKPTPAPRRGMGTENETHYSKTSSKMEDKSIDSGIVYDSATLKMSVKDKISKFGQPGTQPESSGVVKKEPVSKADDDVVVAKRLSLPQDSSKSVASIPFADDDDTEAGVGLGTRNISSEENMTDSGIVDDDESVKSVKDTLAAFQGRVPAEEKQKTSSLPRDTHLKDDKSESPPVVSKRPKSMFAVLETRPDLKKHKTNESNAKQEESGKENKRKSSSGDKPASTDDDEVILV